MILGVATLVLRMCFLSCITVDENALVASYLNGGQSWNPSSNRLLQEWELEFVDFFELLYSKIPLGQGADASQIYL